MNLQQNNKLNIEQQRFNNWTIYQTESTYRIQMLNDNWIDILKNKIRGMLNPDAWRQIYANKYYWNTSINVMKNAINRTATLYNRPPVRMLIDDNENIDDSYERMMLPIEDYLNRIMNEGLRKSLACGGCLLRLGIVNNEWNFTIFNPDCFEPLVSIEDRSRIAGIHYFYTSIDDFSNYIRTDVYFDVSNPNNPVEKVTQNDKTVEYYEGRNYRYFDQNNKPYLPFVLLRVNYDSDQLINQYEGTDLYDATINAQWYAIQKEWLIRSQTHKQWVIIGGEDINNRNEVLDPTVPILLPYNPSDIKVELHDLNGNPEVYDNSIDKIIEWVASARGYSLSDFKATAQVQSAEALEIQNLAKVEYQNTLKIYFTEIEKEIAKKMILISNAFMGTNIDVNKLFEIKYFNPYITEEEETEQREEIEDDTENANDINNNDNSENNAELTAEMESE